MMTRWAHHGGASCLESSVFCGAHYSAAQPRQSASLLMWLDPRRSATLLTWPDPTLLTVPACGVRAHSRGQAEDHREHTCRSAHAATAARADLALGSWLHLPGVNGICRSCPIGGRRKKEYNGKRALFVII